MESYFPARFLHVKIEALKHELFVVDCQKLSMKTYSNLRQYLSHEKKTIIEYDTLKFRDVSKDFVFFVNGVVHSDNEVIPEECYNEKVPVIQFKWNVQNIKVFHCGAFVTVRASSQFTMEMIKLSLEKAVSENVTPLEDKLSYLGRSLSDYDTLASLDYQEDGNNIVLVGNISVTIKDKVCGLVHEILTNEYKTISELKLAYAARSKRFIYPKSSLSVEIDTPLRDERTLYDCNLSHGMVLHFSNPPYSVSVVEEYAAMSASSSIEKLGTEVTVLDSTTVRELKDMYGGVYKTPLTQRDNLYLEIEAWSAEVMADKDKQQKGNKRVEPSLLKDEFFMHQYQIKHGSKLLVRREKPDPEFEYSCARCGNDVKLKKADLVRCRSCGYRILYKKRSTNADTRFSIYECV